MKNVLVKKFDTTNKRGLVVGSKVGTFKVAFFTMEAGYLVAILEKEIPHPNYPNRTTIKRVRKKLDYKY